MASEHKYIFDPIWFKKYQNILLFFLNAPVLKYFSRYFFRIHGNKSDVGERDIEEIGPNFIQWDFVGELKKVEFRTHNKFSKRLFHGLYYFWLILHIWDTFFANNFAPQYNLGFDTLTVYPDPNVETSSVDGWAGRNGIDEAFNVIRAGGGTVSSDSAGSQAIFLQASATTDQFQYLIRQFFLFDTSLLTSPAVISTAILSIAASVADIGATKTNGIGSPDYHICQSTPASNTAIVTNDYPNFQSTSFGSVTYAGWTGVDTTYNDITLDANGRANISKTGVSKFGGRLSWDINNSFTGTWSSGALSGFAIYFADNAGTSADPKLVITYAGKSPSASQSPSASRSPSSSLSPSISPSSSSSASRSPSASVSPSTSLSPSVSPSTSLSASISPSPSAGYAQDTRGDLSVLPTDTNDLETAYTDIEEDTVAIRDDQYVSQGGSMQYMIHQYKRFIADHTSFSVQWEGKSTLAPLLSPIYLQIFNRSSGGWETLDSNGIVAANIDLELEGRIIDVSEYIDDSRVVVCRVYQFAN